MLEVTSDPTGLAALEAQLHRQQQGESSESSVGTSKAPSTKKARAPALDAMQGEKRYVIAENTTGTGGRFGISVTGPTTLVGKLPDDSSYIIKVKTASPASKSGVHIGHCLVSVNGHTVQGMALAAVLDLIRGTPEGKHLVLGLKEDPMGWEAHRNRSSATSGIGGGLSSYITGKNAIYVHS